MDYHVEEVIEYAYEDKCFYYLPGQRKLLYLCVERILFSNQGNESIEEGIENKICDDIIYYRLFFHLRPILSLPRLFVIRLDLIIFVKTETKVSRKKY